MEPSQQYTHQHEEAAPLLTGTENNDVLSTQVFPFNPNQERRALILACFTIVTLDFGAYMSVAPQIEIFESIICRKHRRSIKGDEGISCKAPEIQGELALLNGWIDTLDMVPGIIMALPYGLLADRVGRRPVILLSLGGIVLEQISMRLISWFSDFVPLRAALLAPLSLLCGGGPQIATSIMYTMVTDVFPVEKRSSIFFIFFAAILVAEIVSTPLSAFLMKWNPWLPYLLGLLCEIIGVWAAILVPETKQMVPAYQSNENIRVGDDNLAPGNDIRNDRHYWINTWKLIKDQTLKFFSSLDRNFICVALALLMSSTEKQTLQFVIQYTSKRFMWSFSRASLLITVKGIVTLMSLLIVLPKISNLLIQRMSPVVKDLRISQGTAWALMTGATLMAFAARPISFVMGLCVFATGLGYYSSLRSVANGLVAPSNIGVLNTMITVSQSIGGMIAGPVLAAAFRKGMWLGGMLVGLPFMVVAVLFFITSCLTQSIKLR